MNADAHGQTKSASDIIVDAYALGRPIVPFLGAGISVRSGFPSMTSITAYLAKVRFMIRHVAKTHKLTDTEYLRVHGWPDFSYLNAIIWRHLATKPEASAEAILSPFKKLTPPSGVSRIEFEAIVREEFLRQTQWDEKRNARIRLVVQSQYWASLNDNDNDAAQKLWPDILTKTNLRGDWYDLMMGLTEGDFDLVDALFLVLGDGRRPASDHVFLAQLADVFRVRLYLSLNFDPLLETALWDEGHAPNVIEVAKDADLPSPASVRDRLTVLKLHGGAYGLRIGERIQESADPNTQTRAKNLIPEDALILVFGFSGYERRMTQILVEHCRRNLADTQLLWMNFGNSIDKPLEKILDKFKDGSKDTPIAVRKYHGVSNLLQNILIRARGAHPAGRQAYHALPTSPWAENLDSLDDDKPIVAFYRNSDWSEEKQPQGHSDASVAMAKFCDSKAKSHHIIWLDCEQHHTVDGVITEILDAIYQFDPKFQPLLMQTDDDNEVQYSRPIRRIREALQRGNYVLAIDSPETIGRPQTVHHGTPSFILPGEEPNSDEYKQRVQKFNNRVNGFFTFLTNLLTQSLPESNLELAGDIGGSYICVAFAPPSSRHLGSEKSQTVTHVLARVTDLRIAIRTKKNFIKSIQIKSRSKQSPLPGIDFYRLVSTLCDSSFNLTPADCYTVLAVMRRPRSHLAYYALLHDSSLRLAGSQICNCSSTLWNILFGSNARLKTLTETTTDGPLEYEPLGARRLGDSLLWLPRLRHNSEYNRLTDPGQNWAKSLLCGEKISKQSLDLLPDSILSLHATAILQRRAARYYFSEVYEATGDINAFREYIYHCVSYLRTVCRFLGVAAWGSSISETAKEWETRSLVAYAAGKYRYPQKNRWEKLPIEPQITPSWDEIRNEFRLAWLGELGAFRATISREFDTVLQKLYAGTWIGITDRLLEIDLKEMFNDSFFQLKNETSVSPDLGLCRRELALLKEDILSQQRDARFEMADWNELLKFTNNELETKAIERKHLLIRDIFKKSDSGTLQVRATFKALTPEYVYSGISRDSEARMPSEFINRFIEVLNFSEERLRRSKIYHELTYPSESEDTATLKQGANLRLATTISDRLRAWLDALEREGATENTKMPLFSKEIKDLLHSRLTKHQLDILGTQTRFQFDRLNPLDREKDSNEPQKIASARDLAICLLEFSRRTVFHDGQTYNYFRAKSLRMIARCDYLSSNEPDRFSKPIGELSLALRILNRHGCPDPLEQMACYRAKAEAFMLWAKDLLHRKQFKAARNRLSAARSAIDHAGMAFDRRRRNVAWWLRLCHHRALWAVSSCRLRIREFSGLADSPNPLFENDLRYGLDAIRAGFDALHPIHNSTQATRDYIDLVAKANAWQWSCFAKLWLDLQSISKEVMKEDFQDYWESANFAARLPSLWECGIEQQSVETILEMFQDRSRRSKKRLPK